MGSLEGGDRSLYLANGGLIDTKSPVGVYLRGSHYRVMIANAIDEGHRPTRSLARPFKLSERDQRPGQERERQNARNTGPSKPFQFTLACQARHDRGIDLG